MSAASKTVHFTIDGEWFTDFVRTRVIEGRWDHAYECLVPGIHGCTHEIAIAILKGDQKFIGSSDDDDGLQLVDDDDVEYKQRLLKMFTGVYVTSSGRFLQPYAVVTSWGPEDMNSEIGTSRDSDNTYSSKLTGKNTDYSYRSLFYANDPERDVLRHVPIPKGYKGLSDGVLFDEYSVLFREVRNYPGMIVPAQKLNDAKGAVREYLAAGNYLNEVGYNQTFPARDYPVRQVTPVDETPDLKATMSMPNSAEDVDTIRNFYDTAKRDGDEETAKTLAEILDTATANIGDVDKSFAARLGAWKTFQIAQKRAHETTEFYREKIIEQAGDDFFDLVMTEGFYDGSTTSKTLRVPRAPFERWALNRTSWYHLGPEWKPVCPSGLKMMGDDPYHTDWIIGAGLEPQDWNTHSDNPLFKATYDLLYEVQHKYMKVKVAVLSGSGKVFGKIVHLNPGEKSNGRGIIAVIKNAGPNYVEAAQEAADHGGAIITEVGGSVAHLVTVFRERDLRIVRAPKASTLYPEGRYCTVNCDTGEIILDDRSDSMRLADGTIIPIDPD